MIDIGLSDIVELGFSFVYRLWFYDVFKYKPHLSVKNTNKKTRKNLKNSSFYYAYIFLIFSAS